jgi:hypothetical protein
VQRVRRSLAFKLQGKRDQPVKASRKIIDLPVKTSWKIEKRFPVKTTRKR